MTIDNFVSVRLYHFKLQLQKVNWKKSEDFIFEKFDMLKIDIVHCNIVRISSYRFVESVIDRLCHEIFNDLTTETIHILMPNYFTFSWFASNANNDHWCNRDNHSGYLQVQITLRKLDFWKRAGLLIVNLY